MLVDELMEDMLYKGVRIVHRESFVKKVERIISRFRNCNITSGWLQRVYQ